MDRAYFIQSPYYEMRNGMAYLYLDENHKWTLDPTRVKFFDTEKRAREIANISGRICEVKLADIEEV